MNKEHSDLINKFLLIGDTFMPEMHLYQLKIGKYSACSPFTKHEQRIKNVYFNVLDDIVDKHNNTYHSSIKIKPKDVTDSVFVECSEKSNKKDPKFKIGDNVRISKYKNVFAKGYTPNWSEGIFVVKKIKSTVPWTYVISDLNGEEIVGSFYGKELQKTDQKEFRIEKVIQKKGDKLYVKWKGYDNSFNSWINKKDLV